jgi:beta-lactam-binding protein with PASTA domain
MEGKTSTTAVIALIISILALILAWTAFNRAGQDLTAVIEQEVEEAAAEIRLESQQAEMEIREGTADTLEAGADALNEGAMDARTDDDGVSN